MSDKPAPESAAASRPKSAALQRGVSTTSSQRKRPDALGRGLSTLSEDSSRPPIQRNVSTLSSRSKRSGTSTGAEPVKPTLQRQILTFCSHFSLIFMIGIYTALGGFIFVKLEHPKEAKVNQDLRQDAKDMHTYFVNKVWNYTKDHVVDANHCPMRNRDLFNLTLLDALRKYEDLIYSAADAGVNVSSKEPDYGWTYAKAMFFSATVITTIGYGNIAPVTTNGRIFCIIYAIFGIPLTLIVVADMGILFARFVKFCYKAFKASMEARLAAKIAAEKAKDLERAKRGRGAMPSPTTTMAETAVEATVKVNRMLQSMKVLGALLLLLLYISFGAALFTFWEDWDFFEAFYFCFITMTTIGLGDIVPEHPYFMLLCTVYILIGLALTSTCIELARSEYEKSWERMVEASKRLQGLSGVNLADTLKKLGDHMDLHGEIVDFDLLKDLKNAVRGLRGDNVDDEDPENAKPPPFIMYETTV